MQEKIHWITNLRGIACMMVVMIHSTSWYITHPHAMALLQIVGGDKLIIPFC